MGCWLRSVVHDERTSWGFLTRRMKGQVAVRGLRCLGLSGADLFC
jgi:hypothetical protein